MTSLIMTMAERYSVDPAKFYQTLKATAFKQSDPNSLSESVMLSLMVVANQYGLNPFTGEIYAFPTKNGAVVPVVGVDGWSRIINDHPAFDGLEFVQSDTMVKMPGAHVECPEWMEVIIYRKDRNHPIRIREYLDEVYRPPIQKNGQYGPYAVEGAWQTHTKRQLRHKTLIQGSRVAFGFGGIYDADEAGRIRDMGMAEIVEGESDGQVITGQVQPGKPVEHPELDPILDKLVERALSRNAWAAGYEYVKDRYHGTEQEYAVRYLRKREADAIDVSETDQKVEPQNVHKDEAAPAGEAESHGEHEEVQVSAGEEGSVFDALVPDFPG